jgi:DNA replication and repair protein RecF
MYLSPSLRRDFLDNILLNTFDKYEKILKEYKNILKSRNKTLKAINEGKAKEEELNFWDDKFIFISKIIYNFRFGLRDYLVKNLKDANKYFFGKINKIEFKYLTKIKNDIEKDIKNYLIKNRQRDIILATTSI